MNECRHLIKLYSCINQQQMVLLSISGKRLDVELFAFKKSIILMSVTISFGLHNYVRSFMLWMSRRQCITDTLL